ncbi:MAG: glycosyltransferase [bacterium]|nr:glycosyltransferase [bacterium]
MNILIAGYAYIRENYFNTFKFYPESEKISFLLPKIWKSKGGKVVFHPPKDLNIFLSRAYFYHSHYPLVGGLLKGWIPVFPFVLKRLKKEKKLNVVYSPSEPVLLTTLYQGFWSKFFGLKHIIFTWENISYDKKLRGFSGLIKKLILWLNIYYSDGIICGNKKAEAIIKDLTKKPTAVIPLSGVDEVFFKPEEKESSKEKYNLTNKIVFTFIGAIGHRKGIHFAIESFKDVVKEIPNARLIIAGSGEYDKEIDELIKKLNLSDCIVRMPWIGHSELRHILSASDVFLYPSFSYGGWEEQFGYSMAEASLMELPVISTLSGSINEVVIDRETGILVKPEDVPSLKEAMIELGQNEDLRHKMGKAGRNYIVNNFSNKIIAGKFYEFFKKITLHS